MQRKTAKIGKIRERFGIPKDGFASESEALTWYKAHFKVAKNQDFMGGFGFCYDSISNRLELDYQGREGGLFIGYPYPLDNKVAFDREVSALAKKLGLVEWAAPALRLIVLMGRLTDNRVFFLPDIPLWLIAPLGQLCLLLQPATKLSLRDWRRRGERLGVLSPGLTAGINYLRQKPVIIQGYGEPKKSKKQELYWQVLEAYIEVGDNRRQSGRKGRWGILKETAELLKNKHGWTEPDQYTVKRYLDRAGQRWYITESKIH